MEESLYQIREFAKRSGVTVRTLHHYDHLGLLKPTLYSESGYRLYSDRDLGRLQQIVTLKFIGFSLKKIRDLFDGDLYDLETMLQIQRQIMEEKRNHLKRAITAIGKAERIVASGAEPDWDTFIQIIEVITMENNNEKNQEFFRKYYTEEQMEQFAERATANPGIVEKGQQDWSDLIKEVEASLDEDPAGEKAQSLAARWDNLVKQFTQGDPEITERLKNLYKDQENWPTTFKKPYSDEVEVFINKARKIGGYQ